MLGEKRACIASGKIEKLTRLAGSHSPPGYTSTTIRLACPLTEKLL
jgi:hypothetical protein